MNNGFLGFSPVLPIFPKNSVAYQVAVHTISTGNGTRINFEVINSDEENCITIGSGVWRYTVKHCGYYAISWQIGIQSGVEMWSRLYINNVAAIRNTHSGVTTSWNSVQGVWYGYLQAGDIVYVVGISASGTPNTVADWTWINFLFIR